jgi:hypothetical protein
LEATLAKDLGVKRNEITKIKFQKASTPHIDTILSWLAGFHIMDLSDNIRNSLAILNKDHDFSAKSGINHGL